MSSSTKGASTKSVVSSIVFNGAIFLGFTLAFLVLRLRFKRIYQPKSLNLIIKINKDQKYLEPLPSGFFNWIPTLLAKPKSFIIQQAGLDGYFFLRYLLVFASVATLSLCIIFPILLPVNATGGNGKTGLDQLSFSNVKNHKKYYAHAILGLVFYPLVLYVIYRELIYYTYLRQCILSSPKYAYKLSSRVVLFQSVPGQYLNEKEFKKLFEGVKKIWKATADKKLEKVVDERKKLANDLESTLNGLLIKSVKTSFKSKKDNKEIFGEIDELSTYIPKKKLPTIKKYKFFGAKKDKLNHLKKELIKVNKEIDELKSDSNENKSTMNSIFVEFENQYFAQLAHQSIIHHEPWTMSEHFIGVEPKDIVWINMRLFWYERLIRNTLAIAAIVALVIFWAIPVAFVGVISNINYLINKLHFLKFINNLPDVLLGLITSLLPTVLLSILMSLLPTFIRLMGKLSGAPTLLHVEYFTQQAYFSFQVIQVFLITTITSSAASVVTQIIDKPTSAMNLLSENLPSASNFYVSYIVLQSFSISGALFLQITTLVLFYVLSFILDKTVRKKWNRFANLKTNSWGTDFPPYTNLCVISLAYSIISPIMLLFTAAGFFILYIAYLYYLCYVNNNGAKDSRGIHYPRALFQTIVGIYIGQICLLGLFAVAKAWGAVAIDAVSLGITVFVHVNLNNAFDELTSSLPVDSMKALDGNSETPSFNTQLTKLKSFDDESIESLDEKNSTNSFNLGETAQLYDSLAHTPLLAEGDVEKVPEKPENFLIRFFKPHVYLSYRYCKQTLPEIYNHVDINDLDQDKNSKAYDYPAVHSLPPKIWIPKDELGLSKRFILEFDEIIEISDEGAEVYENGKIRFTGPPPEFEGVVDEKIINSSK